MEGIKEIYAVMQKRVEKYPFAEENDECMPGFMRVYSENTEISYDPLLDLQFDTWEQLVKIVYERRRTEPPYKIQSVEELLGKEMIGPDGPIIVDSIDSYLYCYGLESANLYWIREVSIYAAFCLTWEAAARFIENHVAVLCTPYIVPLPLDTLLD